MWSYGDCIKFCITAFKHIPKIIGGINIINKDTLNELSDAFTCEQKNVSSGIDKIVSGVACNFWINSIIGLLILLFSLGQFSGMFGTILGISAEVVGIGIGVLINSLLIMCMYNHQESWSGIWLKIYVVLVIINVIFSMFGIVGGLFSFSIIGILKIVCNIASLLCFGLVLQGILE